MLNDINLYFDFTAGAVAQEEGARGDMIPTTTKASGKKLRLALLFIKLDSNIKSCSKIAKLNPLSEKKDCITY